MIEKILSPILRLVRLLKLTIGCVKPLVIRSVVKMHRELLRKPMLTPFSGITCDRIQVAVVRP